MRLTCPACAAAYNVPDAMIGTGRQMRCARCGHQWFATPAQGIIEPSEPPPPPSSPPEPVETVSTPVPEPAAPAAPEAAPPPPPAPRARGAAALLLAWVASLASVVGGAAAAWVFRADLVALWPPFGRLVGWLGG